MISVRGCAEDAFTIFPGMKQTTHVLM